MIRPLIELEQALSLRNWAFRCEISSQLRKYQFSGNYKFKALSSLVENCARAFGLCTACIVSVLDLGLGLGV